MCVDLSAFSGHTPRLLSNSVRWPHGAFTNSPHSRLVKLKSRPIAVAAASAAGASLHNALPVAAQVLLNLLGVPPTRHNDEVATVNEG